MTRDHARSERFELDDIHGLILTASLELSIKSRRGSQPDDSAPTGRSARWYRWQRWEDR